MSLAVRGVWSWRAAARRRLLCEGLALDSVSGSAGGGVGVSAFL
jgi:hypothetical protein